ncbi:hypothetical protein M0804_013295 [Polistes exclamans]|nr:hypothetical protein M0804_013295 [Polistes exclamans]
MDATSCDEVQINYYRIRALSMINTFTLEGNELFYMWLNKFEYVADMIEVPDDKMIQLFEKLVDNNVHKYVKETLVLVIFSELSYDEIINHYLRFFAPSYDGNLHRSRFLCRNQYENETIEKYAHNLRKIYNKCDYNILHHEEELLGQFLNGIRDDEMKIYLNNYFYLSFDDAIDKAIEYEKVNDITYYLDKASQMIRTYNSGYKRVFYKWLNKFEYTADILGIPEMNMVRFFNKKVSDCIHTNVKKDNPSVNFFELSYEDIIKYYLRYFAPSYEIDLHMKRFMCRKQYLQESIEKYANNLKKIYKNCNYTENMEQELYVRFVTGVRDDDLRKYLNENPELSFDETVAKAIKFTKVNDLSDYLIPARTMIKVYNPDKDLVFYCWINKFEFVADFVGVPNTKMVQFFNKMVTSDVHTSVQEVNPSVKLSELPYDEIINYYIRYFAPCYESDLHRSRFMCRMQYENEKIERYADSLRKIYNKCCHSNYSEDTLSEKFINGIHNDIIRMYLSNMPKLSYDDTVAFAIAFTKEIISLLNE